MNKPVRIYFLCFHNRCRSQIAAAFAKHYGKEHVIVESAGLEASELHPSTVQVMKEVGIDISDQVAKRINMKTFLASNVIVKLCERAKEKCPLVPFGITNLEWSINDPLEENENDIDAARSARDEIEHLVVDLLKGMNIPV